MPLRGLIARRSVRNFSQEPVPIETIRTIVDVARWTGSARNRQPWKFVAVNDPAIKAGLAKLGAYAGFLADAPVVLVVLSPEVQRIDTEFDVGRVAQSLTLAATDAGLGSCLASLYPTDNAMAAAELVRAESGWVARHAIALGYPAEPLQLGKSAIPVGRHEIDDVLTVL